MVLTPLLRGPVDVVGRRQVIVGPIDPTLFRLEAAALGSEITHPIIALFAFIERAAAEHLDMRHPVLILVAGIVVAALAHVGAYVTQLILYNETACRKILVPPQVILWLCVVLIILSPGAFCWGAISAVYRCSLENSRGSRGGNNREYLDRGAHRRRVPGPYA
jgi:hypothetical protein